VDEDTSAIEREIYEERQELNGNLQELEYQAKALVDWRRYYRNHTGTVLAAVFGGGLLLGYMSARPSSSPYRRSLAAREPWSDGSETRTRPHRERNFNMQRLKDISQNTRAGRQLSDTLSGIFDALIGVASTKAVQLVSQNIPGFRDEFESRQGHRRRTGSDQRM